MTLAELVDRLDDAVRPSLPCASPTYAWRPASVLALQRSVGNRAAIVELRGARAPSVVQRRATPVVQRQPLPADG